MNYLNAPIREAIIDVQVLGLDNINQEQVENLHIFIEEKYPLKKILFEFHGKFQIKDTEVLNDSKSLFKGIIFSNKENNRKVQFRTNGFSFNFLSPYTNWEEFYTEASVLWEIYIKELNPLVIKGIGLRYINRIDLPKPFNNFQEYITNMPIIPNSLPQFYNNFFCQIETPCKNKEFKVVITETIESDTKEIVQFILDIDVFKNIDSNFDFKDLNKMRDIKNLVFEDIITDKTRDLLNK